MLHPAGPEAAKKDEVEEEKQLKSVVPPKKPAKPSKPPKKPITTATATGTGPAPLLNANGIVMPQLYWQYR